MQEGPTGLMDGARLSAPSPEFIGGPIDCLWAVGAPVACCRARRFAIMGEMVEAPDGYGPTHLHVPEGVTRCRPLASGGF